MAVQALYQWQVTGGDPRDILSQFAEDRDYWKVDKDYFRDILMEVPGNVERLDALLVPFFERSITTADPVELAILRLAAYELLQRLEVPYRVVLDEAINLEKTFGAEQGHRFVNGVLDKLGRQLRVQEMRSI